MSSFTDESDAAEWFSLAALVPDLERTGLVTRTFRRLDRERQTAILDAILDEAAVKGPTAISIKEVARRAGVSVGALYTYFGNREGLLGFAAEVCVRSLTALFDTYGPVLTAMPLRDALAAYVNGGVEWGRATKGLCAFFARGAYQGDPALLDAVVRPVSQAMRATIRLILEAAIARGEVSTDIDLDATTRIIHSLTAVLGDAQLLPYLNVYLHLVDDEVPPSRAIAAALDLVLIGIATNERR